MKKKVIGLIDGQSGNIGSINKAIKDIIKGRPFQLKIIKSHFNYSSFDKIILPGQGAYATLMSNLKKLKIIQPLKKYLENNSSYLGICVGMQILSDWGPNQIKFAYRRIYLSMKSYFLSISLMVELFLIFSNLT